jgi:PAS domain S-box-containing protein
MEVSNNSQLSPVEYIRMEEGFKKRKEMLENVIQRAPTIIIGVNANGRIMIFNESAVKISGYSQEEAIGESFILLLMPEKERVEMTGMLEDLEDGNQTLSVDKHIVCRNGDERQISWNIAPMNNGGQKNIGYIYMGFDITEKEIMMSEIVRRNKELTAVTSVGMAISHTMELDLILKNALEMAVGLVWRGVGSIYIVDEKEKQLVLKASRGLDSESEQAFKKIEITKGIMEQVLESNNPILISDFSLLPEESKMVLQSGDINSLAIMPLRSKRGPLGIMVIGTKESMKLGTEDIQVLNTISAQIGMAVDNAQLFKKVVEAEKEWENTFNFIGIPIAIIGKDRKILKLNLAYAAKLNEDVEDVIGKDCEVLLKSLKMPENQHYLETIVDTGGPVVDEVYDSETGMTTLVGAIPYYDEKGEVMGFVQAANDITEKIESQNEIAYLKEFNERIVENLGDGLELIGEDFKIQYMNNHFYNSVKKDVIGKTCYDVHFGRDEPCQGCPMKNGIGKMDVGTLECQSKSGEKFLVTHSPLRNLDGSKSAILLYKVVTPTDQSRPITEENHTTVHVCPVISGIAHELNNPVDGVLGNAQSIIEERDPEKIKQYSKEIINTSKRLSGIIDWYSEYSHKPRDGPKKPFDLNEIIKICVESLRKDDQLDNVEVTTDLSPVPMIKGNALEIQDVLMNLLSYSLEAMNGNGKIHLTTKTVNSTVQAVFSDSSSGIPKELLDRIIKPPATPVDFDCSDNTTPRENGMISKLLRKHDAEIEVESWPGRGTSYTINFAHTGTGS